MLQFHHRFLPEHMMTGIKEKLIGQRDEKRPCVSCNSSEKRKEKYSCREVGGEEVSHKKDAKETQPKDQSNVNDEDDEDVVDAYVKQRNRVMTLYRKLRSLSLTKLIEAMFLLRIRREYQFLDLRRFC
ncbi:hypothetical protein Bca101_009212 [Brassica carinata]